MEKHYKQDTPFRKGSKGKSYGQSGIQKEIDKAMGEFRKIDTTTNLWEGAKNYLEGIDTEVKNPYEDLKLNTESYDYQKQLVEEQTAEQLDMQRQIGGSGMGGYAMMASQNLQKQAAAIGEVIRKDEQNLQLKKAQGEQFKESAEYQRQVALGTAEGEVQKIRLQGEADARDLTLQAKQGELSFLSGQLGAANANEDADFRKGQNFWGSDRRLKKNINLIGKSLSGLNIYSFEYKNPIYGEGIFQGVMSDEIPQEAVINNGKYDMVNYSMLDVEFKQI